MSEYVDNTTDQFDAEESFMGWDRGIDYQAKHDMLEQAIATTRDRREKGFYAVALIQLKNGARRSEALECAFEWAKSGKREYRIRARKRKDKFKRLMVIPPILSKYPVLKKAFTELEQEEHPAKAYYYFCSSRLGHNTHCMRYAFISDVANKEQKPGEFIAKMTGQKNPKVVLTYISQKAADMALRARVAPN